LDKFAIGLQNCPDILNLGGTIYRFASFIIEVILGLWDALFPTNIQPAPRVRVGEGRIKSYEYLIPAGDIFGAIG